jgi:hypothetical protein
VTLLYDAPNSEFARRVVDELRAAGIPCYFAGEPPVDHLSGEPAGGSVREDASTTYEQPDPKDFQETPEEAERREVREQSDSPPLFGRYVQSYPVYVDRDEDYQRASTILIKLGAAKDLMLKGSTIEAINRWAIALAVLTVIIIVLFVLQSRH